MNKSAAKCLENNARQYMTVDGLLFKIVDSGRDEPDTVLCIPTCRVHVLLDFYHTSIMGGHAGITKCYQIISQHFYCPNLAEHLRAYITGCHMCQLFKKGENFQRPLQKRMNINVPAMMKLSIDIKHMPPNHGYSHILVLLCEVSHYMPLHSPKMPHILDVLAYFGAPSHIVCDQDPAFTSSLMEAFATQLNIKLIMISPTNQKSLQAEHGIKSLSRLLVKHLSEAWSWHSLLPYAMMSYNAYSTPILDSLSPYELVFGHKMKISHELEIKPEVVVSGAFQTYYERLKKNLKYLAERLQKFRSSRTDLLNKNRQYHAFEVGQIVYMYQARGSIIQTGSRKINCHFLGPLVVYKAIGPNQFLLMSLLGQIYPFLVEEMRLKHGVIWTTQGNVHTLAELKQVLNAEIKVADSQLSNQTNQISQPNTDQLNQPNFPTKH